MQRHAVHVRTKRARTMMVLPVDIVRNSTAHGHEAGARCDGQKPASREKHLDQIGEGYTTFAAYDSRRLVEPENAVETAALDELASAVETDVSVAAAMAKGK